MACEPNHVKDHLPTHKPVLRFVNPDKVGSRTFFPDPEEFVSDPYKARMKEKIIKSVFLIFRLWILDGSKVPVPLKM